MQNAFSDQMAKHLPLGKYTRWADDLSNDSLMSLLWTVHVFGEDFNSAQRPPPEIAEHSMDEARMVKALEILAAIQKGEQTPEPQAGGPVFTEPAEAFTEEFAQAVASSELRQCDWLTGFTNRQLWVLLWHVGEYGIRANSMNETPPPRFGVDPQREQRMRNALKVLMMVQRGEVVPLGVARTQIESA